MLFHSLKLSGLLSFGPGGIDLPMEPLNVLIGPNGSGKSNLLEAISLLQAAPRGISEPISRTGGVREWAWKGAEASDSIVVEVMGTSRPPSAVFQRPDVQSMTGNTYLTLVNRGGRSIVAAEQVEPLGTHPDTHDEVAYKLYVRDLECPVTGGTVSLFLQETGDREIPASSVGRFAVLEPVGGFTASRTAASDLHQERRAGRPGPLADDLLVEASGRSQLVVTSFGRSRTLTDLPESVVVCEKHDGQTQMRRLHKTDLAKWLKDYRLGDLWTSGELGGNRW